MITRLTVKKLVCNYICIINIELPSSITNIYRTYKSRSYPGIVCDETTSTAVVYHFAMHEALWEGHSVRSIELYGIK